MALCWGACKYDISSESIRGEKPTLSDGWPGQSNIFCGRLMCMAPKRKKWAEKGRDSTPFSRHTFSPSMRLVFRSFNRAQCAPRLISQAGHQRREEDTSQRKIYNRPFAPIALQGNNDLWLTIKVTLVKDIAMLL